MIQKNKVTTYLLYGIGEIVLVVVGILIAVQIDNWNNDKKDRDLENNYYCRFLEDIGQDQKNLDTQVIGVKNRLGYANDLLAYLQNDVVLKDSVSKLIIMHVNSNTENLRLTNSAFEDLKSGSNLKIIKNIKVKESLNTYFNLVNNKIGILNINSKYALDQFIDNRNNGVLDWKYFPSSVLAIDTNKVSLVSTYNEQIRDQKILELLVNEAYFYITIGTRAIYHLGKIKEQLLITKKILTPPCNIKSKDI